MKQIPRDSWAMIQCVIRRYPENKEEYANARQEILESTPTQDGQPRGNYPANRLETAMISLHSPRMERMKREIDAVEEVYKNLKPEYQKVIRLRFWSDRYKNIPFLRMEKCISYSERQMRRICTMFVYEVGKKMGEI